MTDKRTEVRSRQNPLMKRYLQDPEHAMVTDAAWTTGRWPDDPFHGQVVPDKHEGAPLLYGIHERVGGLHDGPTAGDILCAALASCVESTVRMVAGRFGVELEELSVRVEADVDVRGTLMVDPNVAVPFQQFRTDCHIKAAPGTDPALLQRIAVAAEHCCIVLQTLRTGVDVATSFDIETPSDRDTQSPPQARG